MQSSMSETDLQFLGDRLKSHYRELIVDAFIVNLNDRTILLQKRSLDRKLFPGFWDPVGGHLEEGESLAECLRREIREESTMTLNSILALVHQFEWDTDKSVLNLQFVCLATGTPTPEVGKVSEVRWVREDQLDELGPGALTPPLREGLLKAFNFMRMK